METETVGVGEFRDELATTSSDWIAQWPLLDTARPKRSDAHSFRVSIVARGWLRRRRTLAGQAEPRFCAVTPELD